jgi:hypothetical protein
MTTVILYDLVEVDMEGREFARVSRAESVLLANPDDGCEKCCQPVHDARLGPFTVVWQPGSDVIPDFLFGYQKEFMVTDRVKAAFDQAGLTGFVSWPLKMKPSPSRKHRKQPIVSWPYTGPSFWDIHVTNDVEVLHGAGTVEWRRCSRCGREACEPVGDEEKWDIVVDRRTWTGSDFMNPTGLFSILLSERAADVIASNRFTNVEVRRVGRFSD